MADFKPVIDALIHGESAALAVYVALIGVLWQIVYAIVKDRLARKDAAERFRLESEKFASQSKLDLARFEHERGLENQKFEYDKLKWRETLSLEVAKRLLDARLEAYPPIWELVRAVARHTQRSDELHPDRCKALAQDVETWRYGKGGLLAEDTTRDAALALQSALWEYDGSPEGYRKVRLARRLVRKALRADMGLGSEGQDIFYQTAVRQRIAQELAALGVPREGGE
jgi:hypothetical protein